MLKVFGPLARRRLFANPPCALNNADCRSLKYTISIGGTENMRFRKLTLLWFAITDSRYCLEVDRHQGTPGRLTVFSCRPRPK